MTQQLDLLKYQPKLIIKKEGAKRYIYCAIRKKYLVLQPEELVRQLTIHYLIEEKGFNKNHIHVERGFKVNGLYRRLDIIIYDEQVSPYLMVECKAPRVKLSQATFDQIAQYNLKIKGKYLMVTNGINSIFCEMNYETQSYRFLNEIPSKK
jgi:hypothetical protein